MALACLRVTATSAASVAAKTFNAAAYSPPRSSAAMSQLSQLLSQSRALTSHLNQPDLPTINLGLEQIEEGSRRLVKRPGGAESKAGEGSG
jgi:hypothetical protein